MEKLVVLNFKCYKSGKEALKLAKTCGKLIKPKNLVIVPQHVDIANISKLGLTVFAQHVDLVEKPTSTGHIDPKSVKAAGATGTLLNHAEHRVELPVLKKTVELCKTIGLKVMICAPSVQQAKEFMSLEPDYIAFEEPTLISTGKSISQMQSEDVKQFANMFKDSKIVPLCGAGVSTGDDLKKALQLGTQGALIASAVANSQTPEKVLSEFAKEL